MLTPRTIIDRLTAESFRSFRIHMASGRSFEIPHPEVGRSSMTVSMRPGGEASLAERWQKVSLMLLESVEPIEAKMASSG